MQDSFGPRMEQNVRVSVQGSPLIMAPRVPYDSQIPLKVRMHNPA